jgi:pantetheine-phosphate adenylyltransferase
MKKGKRQVIYPGSFDPVTLGHLDLIERARVLFDEVHVAVARNTRKAPLFSVEERVGFLKKTLAKKKGVFVMSFDGLVVDYARSKGIQTIMRGVRAISDFDYEFRMAVTNRHLNKRIDTIFLMPSEDFFYLSSRLVKEVARLGGDVGAYVPPLVCRELANRNCLTRRVK